MKNNKVRLTESQLHNVIKESVKNILNEVQLHYGTDNDSYTKEDPFTYKSDRGHSYDYSQKFTNEIKEDYVALAQRLEKLTGTEWHIQPHTSYRTKSKWAHGDYIDNDYFDEGIDFVTTDNRFGNYHKTGDIMDKAEKMVSLFFGKHAYVYSNQKDGCFFIAVSFKGKLRNWNADRSHENSRIMKYGKKHTGYTMGDKSSLKGYTHPYPNDINGMGAAQEEEWFNSTKGNPWFGADRNNTRVKDTIDRWREYYETSDDFDFDEY